MTAKRALTALSLPLSASVALAACGGGVNPAMQGREGMLSQTAIAKKCDEAKEGHDRPFVVEWDATDLASFEAAAQQRTLLVKYEGCSLKVLYECRDPVSITRFGAYGLPQFTSGTVQGFDMKNEGELYAKLPLGASSLSGRLKEGESLHLQYFVSGVATSSRESIFANELRGVPGCEGATHFVWGYNLGAFELETQSRAAAEANASVAGLGSGGGRGSRESVQIGHGGTIASCSTQDQRGCRVPVRLALRPVRPGDNPLDKAGGGIAALGAGGAVAGGAVPASVVAAKEAATAAASASEALAEANRMLHDKHDGVACLALIDRALAIDPRRADDRGVRFNYPRCLMRAGQCEEGKKRLRELFASEDTKRLKSDEALDLEVRNASNMECSSATAKNDTDFVLRASRELADAARAKDVKDCKAGFEKVISKVKSADAEVRAARAAREAATSQSPWNSATSSLSAAAKCVAEGESCAAGLAYHKRAYCLQLRDMKGCEKTATQNWDTQKTLGHLTCK